MKTKIISLFLAIIMTFTLTTAFAIKADAVQIIETTSNLVSSLDTTTGILTISGNGEMDGYPWTMHTMYIQSVVIGEGITSICDYAFKFCEKLRDVSMPRSMTRIGDYAFIFCESLRSITIPYNVTSVGYYAFAECPNLREITILNPNCKLQPLGIYDNITIRGFENSKAHIFAQNYGYKFEPVNATELFNDVQTSSWYDECVTYAVANGLFNGTSETTFSPNASMTRAMLVTVLWRYAGEPMEGENSFADVPDGQWYTDAVAWAAQNGIVGGVGNNKFDPNGNITREQMAAILYRYCNSLGIDTTKRADLSSFPDGKKVSVWAADALSWANAEGLINGTQAGSRVYLDPQGNATRAQVAAILMRLIENVIG